jgi:hypothetical protein
LLNGIPIPIITLALGNELLAIFGRSIDALFSLNQRNVKVRLVTKIIKYITWEF